MLEGVHIQQTLGMGFHIKFLNRKLFVPLKYRALTGCQRLVKIRVILQRDNGMQKLWSSIRTQQGNRIRLLLCLFDQQSN